MKLRALAAVVAAALLVACAPNRATGPSSTTAATTSAPRVSTTASATTATVTATSTNAATATTTNAAAATTATPASGETATTSAGGPDAPSSTVAPATTTVLPALLAGLAAEPAGLARQLTDALRTVRDPSSSMDAVDGAGRREQLVLRRLAAQPESQADTLAAVGDDVRAFATNDLTALNAPGDRALAKPLPPLDTLPVWTIRAPLPATELLGYYREAEAATGIPWPYLAAINLVETRMGRIVGLSSASAIGPMQFLRSTWDACCTGDPTVDRDAIIGAATYLRRRGGPADMGRAILGYNPNDAYRVMIERYAANLVADERLYLGYHAWEVFVATTSGPVRLPVGFTATERVPAAEYVTAHPEDRA